MNLTQKIAITATAAVCLAFATTAAYAAENHTWSMTGSPHPSTMPSSVQFVHPTHTDNTGTTSSGLTQGLGSDEIQALWQQFLKENASKIRQLNQDRVNKQKQIEQAKQKFSQEKTKDLSSFTKSLTDKQKQLLKQCSDDRAAQMKQFRAGGTTQGEQGTQGIQQTTSETPGSGFNTAKVSSSNRTEPPMPESCQNLKYLNQHMPQQIKQKKQELEKDTMQKQTEEVKNVLGISTVVPSNY